MSRQLLMQKKKSVTGRIPSEMMDLIERVQQQILMQTKGVAKIDRTDAQRYIAKEFTDLVKKLEDFKRNSE